MLDALSLEPREGGVVMKLRVAPGSKRERIVGVHGDALKIAIQAPPEQGRANARALALLAEVLGIKPRDVVLLSGAAARDKRVHIRELSADQLRQRLTRLLEQPKDQ